MSSSVCERISTLAEAKYDTALQQKIKIKDPEIDWKIHYAWKIKANGVAYTGNATSAGLGGTTVLLSAAATSLITNLWALEHS